MIEVTRYISDDGEEWDNELDCLRAEVDYWKAKYEQEQYWRGMYEDLRKHIPTEQNTISMTGIMPFDSRALSFEEPMPTSLTSHRCSG